METQKSLLEVLEKRLDTNEEHIALLQSNDTEQDAKIVGLEKADAFLQDTYAEGAKKTDQMEEAAVAQKHELDKLRQDLDDLTASHENDAASRDDVANLTEAVEDVKQLLQQQKEIIEGTLKTVVAAAAIVQQYLYLS